MRILSKEQGCTETHKRGKTIGTLQKTSSPSELDEPHNVARVSDHERPEESGKECVAPSGNLDSDDVSSAFKVKDEIVMDATCSLDENVVDDANARLFTQRVTHLVVEAIKKVTTTSPNLKVIMKDMLPKSSGNKNRSFGGLEITYEETKDLHPLHQSRPVITNSEVDGTVGEAIIKANKDQPDIPKDPVNKSRAGFTMRNTKLINLVIKAVMEAKRESHKIKVVIKEILPKSAGTNRSIGGIELTYFEDKSDNSIAMKSGDEIHS